jgi:hypothetical protein
MRTGIVVIVFLFLVLTSFSQKLEVGGIIGYGVNMSNKTSHNTDGIQSLLLTNYFPSYRAFSIHTGIGYQKQTDWTFITVPIGFVCSPGKKAKFLFGSGLEGSYVFLDPKYYDKYMIISRSDFVLTYYLNIGMSVTVENNWNIFMLIQGEKNITFLYSTRYYSYQERMFILSFNLGISYSINFKK